jgi:Glycosyl transferase family 90
VPQCDSLRFKYLIDVDGNTCSFSRFYWILLSNSVPFKVESDNIQWYYGALTPFVHYIPVARDLSDLVERIDWARNHEEIVKGIAYNSCRFAKMHLFEPEVYKYLYLLLTKYAKLQRFQPSRSNNH